MFSMVLETRTGKLIKDRRENRNTRHTRKPEESLNAMRTILEAQSLVFRVHAACIIRFMMYV